ncbi:MAG: CoA transferase [Myxococcota bacterium]|jgi:crotonobetainyl-CoA:carnitine CoA-transferase CaiB-like acyl-CoA transferase
MPGPLDGYRVIDVTQMISGPVATMILGDQGADVIKVEPPGRGDLTRMLGGGARPMSPIFATSNRNKRGMVLDLKQLRGVEILKQLVAGADVFVQNFRPGAAERMGIGEEALRAVKPDLVYVSISGFGETGPYAQKRVYDPVIQALSGLADIQGGSGKRPRMLRLIVPDKVTALTAAQAMTAALLARERTGKGQHVRLAMLDAVIHFLWPEGMARHTYLGRDVGVSRPTEVRDLVFETKDGFITAGAVADVEWHGLARALGHPEWLEDERFKTPAGRVKYADKRLEMTAEVLATGTSEQWLKVLDEHQVPCAPVMRREDLVDHPQVIANELIVEADYPLTGRMQQARPPVRFDVTPAEIRRPAPGFGEHNDEVLEELGFDEALRRELKEAGVLG